jgi:hypothetical protein
MLYLEDIKQERQNDVDERHNFHFTSSSDLLSSILTPSPLLAAPLPPPSHRPDLHIRVPSALETKES